MKFPISFLTIHFLIEFYFVVLFLNSVDKVCADYEYCWPHNFVPYAIKPGFSLHERNYIEQQIEKINKKTCLVWSDMNETNSIQNLTSYVHFEKESNDISLCQTQTYLSDEPKTMVIIVLSQYCFSERTVLHEIVHALGFDHEHQRIDRDCYVWVSEKAKTIGDYEVVSELSMLNMDRFPYDKESIMHYPRSSRMKALSERWYEWEPLGNDEERLTELDLWKIQYRFCGRPHYCEVHPQHCKYMELTESEKNCNFYFLVFVLDKVGRVYSQYGLCWPHNFVPYAIKPGFTVFEQDYIKQQIDKINQNTCLYWSDMNETTSIQNLTSYVHFQKGPDDSRVCQTQRRFFDKSIAQVTIILPNPCFAQRLVLHEIVHALGFDHEHQRIDRDCYVWVSETAKRVGDYAIDPSHVPVLNLDRFPYDKESVMHYIRSSHLKALSERWYEWEPLGNNKDHLTELDVWKIQYRFCGRPHYCDVHPQHCRQMEQMELEKNCNVRISR